MGSLSLRRAWIEIYRDIVRFVSRESRSPYGERGLKYVGQGAGECGACRSPYGERGLKSVRAGCTGRCRLVALLTESVD